MRFPIECRVCGRMARRTAEATGWRLMMIDRRGDLHASSELDRKSGDLAAGMRMGAYVCGQTDALILSERYFERGTFEPVALAEGSYLANLLRHERDAQLTEV